MLIILRSGKSGVVESQVRKSALYSPRGRAERCKQGRRTTSTRAYVATQSFIPFGNLQATTDSTKRHETLGSDTSSCVCCSSSLFAIYALLSLTTPFS